MSLLEELLAPIEGEISAGPDLRSSNEFAEVEKAFLDADQPSTLSPVGAESEMEEGFDEVVELASEFLKSQSKDLKIAIFLTASLMRVESFKGLADGLEVILGLLKEYWDTMYPGIPSRGPVLDWFGSEDFSYALFLLPLTEFGHRYREYKEWASGDEKKDAKGGDGESSNSFESAFGQTPREWYEELVSNLTRCNDTLAALDAFGKEKFKEAGEKPPRYSDLAAALKRVTQAAQDLLGRKPAPPKPATPEPQPEASQESSGKAEGAPVAPGAPSPQAGPSALPRNKDEAAAVVGLAARVMRQEDPADPSPYLLIRGLRWGELRAGGDHLDPRWLQPPSTEQRTHLKGLFLDGKHPELLEAVEEVMGTPAGRGWLDLQRYAILASERLGSEYRLVAKAIRGALRSLLLDIPSLVDASLMDDSPTASRDTMAWLKDEGLLPGEGESESQAGVDQTRRADRVIRDASYDRATAMVRAGDPQGAIEMLMERAQHEHSARARFITKAEAAGIMVSSGMEVVARPILDELLALIDQHGLENWESGDVVAKPMGLLLRCLTPQEGTLRQKVYPRLAKLDPMLAMEVNRATTPSPGPAASPHAGTPNTPDTPPQTPPQQGARPVHYAPGAQPQKAGEGNGPQGDGNG